MLDIKNANLSVSPRELKSGNKSIALLKSSARVSMCNAPVPQTPDMTGYFTRLYPLTYPPEPAIDRLHPPPVRTHPCVF
jgi:hypothetical protein